LKKGLPHYAFPLNNEPASDLNETLGSMSNIYSGLLICQEVSGMGNGGAN